MFEIYILENSLCCSLAYDVVLPNHCETLSLITRAYFFKRCSVYESYDPLFCGTLQFFLLPTLRVLSWSLWSLAHVFLTPSSFDTISKESLKSKLRLKLALEIYFWILEFHKCIGHTILSMTVTTAAQAITTVSRIDDEKCNFALFPHWRYLLRSYSK